MRVCLINPRFPKSQFLVMNQGLLQLAAEVKRAGHSCEILDFTDRGQAFSLDRLKRFDLVGLSVMTAQLWHAVEIAEALSSHVKVAWGGVHCLLDPLSILNGFPDHYVVSGEGEIPFVNLLEHLEGRRTTDWLSRQKGVCFSLEGRPHPAEPYFIADLEALADVNYQDHPNIARYIALGFHCFQQVIRSLIAVTARGCNWNCSFCINTICKKLTWNGFPFSLEESCATFLSLYLGMATWSRKEILHAPSTDSDKMLPVRLAHGAVCGFGVFDSRNLCLVEDP